MLILVDSIFSVIIDPPELVLVMGTGVGITNDISHYLRKLVRLNFYFRPLGHYRLIKSWL